MEVFIREVEESDYPSLVMLWNNEIGNRRINLENTTSHFERVKNNENYKTFVALLDNNIVGFITTLEAYEIGRVVGFLWICGLAVQEKYQNKGIGTKLLKYIENYALKRGLSSIILNSGFQRINAHIFYEHNGYEKHSYCFSKTL